jgi:hypothetical protein
MKIFNKILRKNFDKFTLNTIDSLNCKTFARNFKNTFESNSSFMKNIDETMKKSEITTLENSKEGTKVKRDLFELVDKNDSRGNQKELKENNRKPFNLKDNFNSRDNQGENNNEFREKKFQRRRYDQDGILFF